MGNRWNVDTGAGIASMNRLTLARIDADPIELHTFDVEEGSAPGEPDGPVVSVRRARPCGVTLRRIGRYRACSSRAATGRCGCLGARGCGGALR